MRNRTEMRATRQAMLLRPPARLLHIVWHRCQRTPPITQKMNQMSVAICALKVRPTISVSRCRLTVVAMVACVVVKSRTRVGKH